MRSVSLRSTLVPDDISIRVGRAAAEDGFYLSVDNNKTGSRTGLSLSHADAHKLRDFLNKELGEQAPESTGSGPWVYLEKFNNSDSFWVQFPTEERARDYAMRRTCLQNIQMLARCHQALVPVTVASTSYEWKDIV
jgi:hypothetical protein